MGKTVDFSGSLTVLKKNTFCKGKILDSRLLFGYNNTGGCKVILLYRRKRPWMKSYI